MSMNIGGAETHILELCRELKKMGEEVVLASFGGVYADELTSFGIEHVTLPLNTKKPASVAESYRGLKELIQKGNFDIVHAHARIPAFICGMLFDKMKFRFVTTAHLNFSVNPLWRRIARWGEYVMAVSDDIADYMVSEYKYPRDRISVTINGVDTKKFSKDIPFDSILKAHGLSTDRRRIVYMSRLDEDRADPAYRILNIAPQIAEKFPDCDIIIVGGGNRFDDIKEKAEEINRVTGRKLITITGAVSNTNEYLASATVFVGVSRSALEAMSASKPVIIAGNQGSLGIFDKTKIEPAILTNFCCRGFDVEDEDRMLSDLSALLTRTPEELSAMGEFNRAFIEERYTARRMAGDYIEMYKKVLASPIPFNGHGDVALSGYYGFGNLGDESLLDIIASSISREVPGVKITAFTKSPKKDARRTGLNCVSRFNLFSVPGELKHAKLLISGGGSLLQDATSRRSLKYYAGVIRLAEHLGCRVCVLANGIGPISDERNKKITAAVIKKADYVSVRDADSKAELISLGVPADKIAVTADPAFLIGACKNERVKELLSALSLEGKKFFSVSLRPFSDPSVFEKIADACRAIRDKYSLVPLIIPMQESRDSDICREFAISVSGGVYVPESASELIGILSSSEFLVGMRLHSVIFAAAAAVPMIGLSYDPKVRSMMSALSQDYCIDLKNEPDIEEKIVSLSDSIMRDSSVIREKLFERASEMREKCEDDLRAIHGMLN